MYHTEINQCPGSTYFCIVYPNHQIPVYFTQWLLQIQAIKKKRITTTSQITASWSSLNSNKLIYYVSADLVTKIVNSESHGISHLKGCGLPKRKENMTQPHTQRYEKRSKAVKAFHLFPYLSALHKYLTENTAQQERI